MDLELFTNKKVVIAVSTGVDSMVLLNKMLQIDCSVFVVYVRHYHRERVHIENEFFIKYCSDNKIHLTTYDYHHINGNFESKARDYRYQCFKEVYEKYNCDYLLTAHHGDDLVETMLMRQLRGTDIHSVGGFREFSVINGMNVARPLVTYAKSDLRLIAENENIPYYEDETNRDISYQRNFLRHEIIPKFNLGYIKKFNNLSAEMYELSDFISDYVSEHITVLNDIYLNTKSIDKRMYKYGIKKCFNLLYENNINDITDKHVHLVENMLENDKVQLPKQYYVFFKDGIYTFTKAISENYCYEYNQDLKVSFLNSELIFSEDSPQIIRLDESVKLPLKIVNAKMDMKIKMSKGHQKLNRVFINAKVPKHKRASWPVLIDSNDNIICVFGIKYSVFCLNDLTNSKIVIKYKCIFKGDDYNA